MLGLRKNTLGKNKFFGYQKERVIKCQQVSWPEDDVKSLRPFFIHLCEAPDFYKGRNCWPPHDSVFIPMCNKRYISKPKNKEMGSVSGKTDFPMSLLSSSPFFWLNSHLVHGYPSSLLILPGLLRSDRGDLSASSPSEEQEDACGLCRWSLVFHVNQVIQPLFLC